MLFYFPLCFKREDKIWATCARVSGALGEISPFCFFKIPASVRASISAFAQTGTSESSLKTARDVVDFLPKMLFIITEASAKRRGFSVFIQILSLSPLKARICTDHFLPLAFVFCLPGSQASRVFLHTSFRVQGAGMLNRQPPRRQGLQRHPFAAQRRKIQRKARRP